MFAFEMKQVVKIKVSGEKGQVEGRAEYSEGPQQYLVSYVDGKGCAVEQWWTEDRLEAA